MLYSYNKTQMNMNIETVSQDNNKNNLSKTEDTIFFAVFTIFQIVSIFMYAFFTEYGEEVSSQSTSGNQTQISNTINHYYPFFQDVHVMIFIGFGFLMTFLFKYSYSSVSYNFLLASLTIQYSILINGFFHNLFLDHWSILQLNIESLITGDFAAGAILISFGALLGKASLLQLLLMIPLELCFYAVNESIGVIEYQAVDMGGSMYVHAFGAYFGLAVSKVLTDCKKVKEEEENFKSTKESDLFAMIGTLFLWIFWPSFNGALALGNSQHRVVINTVLSLSNSCAFAFISSKVLRGKYEMEDIQNAVLAGGVAVGSSADLVIGPYASLIVGAIAGTVSVVGYKYISPFLQDNFDIHDTCGVHNLHGLPGIMGGLGGAISAASVSDSVYGDSITDIFAARVDRTAGEQGLYQLYALLTTLGISIGGGYITGCILSIFNSNPEYGVDVDWLMEEVEEHED